MENNPQTTHKMDLYIYVEIKKHMEFSPRGSCNHFSQLKPIWINTIIIKYLSPLSPLSRGIIAPYNSCPYSTSSQRCILLLIMIKALHFLGTPTSFNCLGSLSFHKGKKIHYLIWGPKTGVLHSPPPYFGTIISAYTKQKSKFQNSSNSREYSSRIAYTCSQVASSRP
jgi:hypothetical protein